MKPTDYCDSLFGYKRVKTRKVMIGELSLGGREDIRVQSMTTTNTHDTESCVQQAIRIIEAGGQIVRLTTQGRAEAQNMSNISDALRQKGYVTPIVADVHYNPAAAEIAAQYAEKVRINPGNFTGGVKRFDASADTMSQEEWMSLIKDKLTPLVKICKENETTLRIGVNHGSLSDRIMAKYGDTSEGMVQSAIEYIEALDQLDFHDIVVSIKASNTRIMVETVRLLMAKMKEKNQVYPLHLGVTEAGSDAEGRIKSAVGIGALLIDGLGDTIRVSLTEAPEAEIPVAQSLVDYVQLKASADVVSEVDTSHYSPYTYNKRKTYSVLGIGGDNHPVVIADATGRKKPFKGDADIVYSNDNPKISAPIIYDAGDTEHAENAYPLISPSELEKHVDSCFVRLTYSEMTDDVMQLLSERRNVVVVAQSNSLNPTIELRAIAMKLMSCGIEAPMIVHLRYSDKSVEDFQLHSAADMGLLFIDGLADGIMLSNYELEQKEIVETSVSILQAAQARFSKAEFISCPGCGRTLYDIQSTVQIVKQRLKQLKGLQIGLMGCIVNGIGEMADAHYGYVGAGPNKISLYRGKELVKKEIPEKEALEQLIDIIKADGKWQDDE